MSGLGSFAEEYAALRRENVEGISLPLLVAVSVDALRA
jgi:hypothetical protein